ncbi:MAG TPA: glycoside hydrolase family 20 zincin-like fold domain-containing protein [Pyrinomonadaceae bacterium]|nr:glycoside hydrolase family 20 zincin-like fold domain-containing protein [Pyrinomonadaceae bacterium]
MLNTLTRSAVARPLVLLAAIVFGGSIALAQQPPVNPLVQLVPQPRQIVLRPNRFSLNSKTRIVLADPRSEDDRFAAGDFADDVRETAKLEIKIVNSGSRRSILVGNLDLPSMQAALKRTGINVPPNLDAEGYVLVVSPDEVVVAGKSAAGAFYGLQTLKQLVRGEGDLFIPAVEIVDWPAMRWRGVSDDISRGPVPTVDYIKRQLRTFAAFKLNMHSFYMEQTFASNANPLIGPAGGSLTPDEIRELVVYARRYHIELVPEQQTFGHLHKALKLERYNELAEMPYGDVLSPQQEGSYKLIAAWYRELNELFPGKFFHIGADETFELGEGQSREAAKARGVGAIYFEHLNRVREVLKPYDRRLMFWGDIALNHPDLIGSIPKDMIVMNWDYAAKDDYLPRIKPFKDAGLEEFVCPGVHNWNQIFPNLDASAKNIANFVRDGQASGALGMMNTSWDDDGEAIFEMTWYGIVLGAAASWQNKAVDQNAFDDNFDWAFFRNDGHEFTDALHALGSVNTVLGIGASDELFWRDPFTSGFQRQVRTLSSQVREMRLAVENADESLLRNEAKARRNRSMIAAMRFAAQRFDHLGRRMQVMEKFSQDYWEAYLNLGDRRKVGRLRNYWGNIYNSLREMTEELTILRESYRKLWLAENRPYWLDSVLARYDQAAAMWLTKSKTLAEAVRVYNSDSTLPAPEEFGLGPRPIPPVAPQR